MPSDTFAKPSVRSALALFIPLLLIYCLSYFQRTGIPGTIFTQLQTDAGLDAVQISLISSSYIWVYALSQVFIGLLVDKYGGVRVVLVGGVLLVVGSVLFPWAKAPAVMYFGRVLTGLGAGTIFLSTLKVLDLWFDRQHYATALGIIYFSAYSGGIFATTPFAWLCKHFAWHNVLLAIALATFVAYVCVAVFAARHKLPPPAKAPLSFRPLLKLVRNRNTWMVSFASNMVFANYFVLQTIFGMKFLQDFCGLSATAASLVILAMTVSSTICASSLGLVCRVFDNRRRPPLIVTTSLNVFVILFLMAAIALHFPSWGFAIGYVLCAFSSCFNGNGVMMIQELNSRDMAALASAFTNMVAYLLVTALTIPLGVCLEAFPHYLGPSGGEVYAPTAYMTVFGIMACLATLSLVVACLLPETHGKYLGEKSDTDIPADQGE
ncbi:MAG: MFS transporter [Victivallales bacterium]|nr:MFS transporter [Victivallales bacterium]